MKLILREYLALLKESDELDSLLPDLLLSMSISPISQPQKGVRQGGVDVAAVGKHPETGEKVLLLFVIKQGDLGRRDWDTGEQSVRQSLNEVRDIYLHGHVKPEHSSLPKHIIVCTGGDLKQDTQQGWTGYIKENQKPSEINYEFWGGAQLSIYLEKYVFNENILPKEFRSKFRKTLALLTDTDYDFSDYYRILEDLLLKADFGDISRKSGQKKVIKTFRTVNLCQNIIFHWATSEENLRPAIYCSERTILNAWEVLRKHELYGSQNVVVAFWDLYRTLLHIYTNYANKVDPYCRLKNGFSGSNHNYLLECLAIFENLGFMSTTGLIYTYQAVVQQNEDIQQTALAIVDMVKDFISNHPSTHSPCYDGQIIEIGTAMYLLFCLGERDFIDDWIQKIISHIVFSYEKMGKYFPIESDSFEDLVELNVVESIDRSHLFQLSTLMPILAQWCVVLDREETYEIIRNVAKKYFPNCTLQIWYPDHDTDSYLYRQNASISTGNVEAPLNLDVTIDEMRNRMRLVQDKTVLPESLSAMNQGLTFLPIIASRHFRTPVLPFYWQSLLQEEGQA